MKIATLLLAGMMMVSTAAPAKSKKSSSRAAARPVVAYTLSTCDECARFRQWLRRAGVKVSVQQVRESPASLYPTVVYSDGRSDHGERLYARQVALPKSLRLVETN